MGKRDGNQQGPQAHAEGQHGEKTHAAFLESLQEKKTEQRASDPDVPPSPDVDAFGKPTPGHHRLSEHREQHDEADKESEGNRLRR
jgi:hypothetical protein